MKKLLLVLSCIFLLSACKSGSNSISSVSETTTPLTIKGSDTEVQLVSNIAEEFAKKNPQASISVTGGGSGVGIAAVINGEADVANSSRKMKPEELDQAKKSTREVLEFVIAYDGLSVIVHAENPIKSLTLEQLAQIYTGKVKNWKDVGGTNSEIVLYGRQSTSGTFTFFRDTVLKTDYDKSMRGLEGNQAILDAVQSDKNGIGYVGAGYVKVADKPRSDIGIVTLKKDKEAIPLSPLDRAAVESLEYPLARKIYQYFPRQILQEEPILKDFLQFENSGDGQRLVTEGGFYSLSPADIASNSSLLNSGQ